VVAGRDPSRDRQKRPQQRHASGHPSRGRPRSPDTGGSAGYIMESLDWQPLPE
jgi:hypothetical protein